MPTVRRTRADVDLSKVDWARLEATTDAEIDAQIAADPDTAPIFTERELARARRIVPSVDADDVRGIRRRLGLSQAAFAARFGFTVQTVRNYEQGHRRPAGPARVLLRVVASEPDAVTRALGRGSGARRAPGRHPRQPR
ncbi:MAG: helix-turn-helix domain-containing protein [Proteobacteria bacterium]|nr:helix-turn-helix domain-containing protein [Pseudomonadota bacterium]MBI3498639.1 helix-turn-helix domain-containing protein [Pseudomonadota bacterium]